MARNVGLNSTFEQQRLVINQLAVDVETLQNAGFLTSYTETDPIFSVSSASTINSGQISNWDTAYGWGDHSLVGYTTITGVGTDGNINTTGIVTATSFYGSGANITNLSAGQLIGALPTIDGSNLTGIVTSVAAGSGISIDQSTGKVTITSTVVGGGGESYWTSEATGLSTTSSIGLSTTPFADVPAMSLPYGGQIVFDKKTNGSSHLVAIGDTTTANPTGRDLNSVGGVYIGNRAGQQITDPGSGILIGNGAGRLITDSNGNIVIGAEAGIGLTSSVYYDGKFSSQNVVIGNLCGGAKMGRYNLILGAGGAVGGGYPVSGGNMGEGCVVIGTFDFNSNGAPIVPLEYGSHQLVIGAGSTNWINGTEDYNVGFGTTNPTSKLTVEGDGKFTGVVTATKFESSSAGTPTIDSPNNLNINAVNVAISTDLTVGGDASISGLVTTSNVYASGIITASSFVGDGRNITNIAIPWTKFYLNTQTEVKPPTGTISTSSYAGQNWGTWYACTFLNSANTFNLSPSNSLYDPTLNGIGFSGDRFSGFIQGGTYEFNMILDNYERSTSTRMLYFGFEASTGAFTSPGLVSPGTGSININGLTVSDSIVVTFEDANTSNNWIRFNIDSDISPNYWVGQAILTIKKIG